MKKALLSSVALVGLFSGGAMGADMAARPIYRAPVPLAVADWTGFYIGGNVGGSIGIINPTDTRVAGFADAPFIDVWHRPNREAAPSDRHFAWLPNS